MKGSGWRKKVAGNKVAGELRQVLILALGFSSGPLTNFKEAFHKIPCGHSPLKVMIMSQKWLPSTLRTVSSQNSPTKNGALRVRLSKGWKNSCVD